MPVDNRSNQCASRILTHHRTYILKSSKNLLEKERNARQNYRCQLGLTQVKLSRQSWRQERKSEHSSSTETIKFPSFRDCTM